MPLVVPSLILASQSPRRRELLAEAGYSFEVLPPRDVAENGPRETETAVDLVARLAMAKVASVAQTVASGVILGCDTVAECDGKVLGKPADAEHALQMLRALSGRKHRVLTGLCLMEVPANRWAVRVAVTTLRMDNLTDDQLSDYLASQLWRGKAGAFGYQDRLGWVRVVDGSESNVVGLPMELLAEMLAGFSAEVSPDNGLSPG